LENVPYWFTLVTRPCVGRLALNFLLQACNDKFPSPSSVLQKMVISRANILNVIG
jgi:hypothetical protein